MFGFATLGCNLVITLNSGGTGSVALGPSSGLGTPNKNTFDGSDDVLVGLINNSGQTVNSVKLTSNLTIFGFDGDGIQINPNPTSGARWPGPARQQNQCRGDRIYRDGFDDQQRQPVRAGQFLQRHHRRFQGRRRKLPGRDPERRHRVLVARGTADGCFVYSDRATVGTGAGVALDPRRGLGRVRPVAAAAQELNARVQPSISRWVNPASAGFAMSTA